jgi:hypothetical protein
MPALEKAEANDGAISEPVPDEEMTAEDVTSHRSDDDSIPEEVQDDGDVSSLIDVDKADGN